MPQQKKYKTTLGYIAVFCPTHPSCKNGYVLEHRLIMEKHLNRYLTGIEIVHHLNGIKTDNRIENLYLCENVKEHHRLHKGWCKKDGTWFKKCKMCKRELEVNKDNFYFRKKGGMVSDCKKCSYKIVQKWKKKNKQHMTDYSRLYSRKYRKRKREEK